jgi:sarcosine oxidase
MEPTTRCDVLLLGVGGMGAAALAHVARRGKKVIGLEQDETPSLRGSSVGESRVIRKAYYEDPRYVPILERAYVLWRELEKTAGEPLFVSTGCMTLGPEGHEAIRGVLESVTRHRLPHIVLREAEVRARFPAIVPTPGDVGVFEQDAGYLHVESCTRAHAQWAVSMGAELRTKTRVTRVDIDQGVHVTLEDGTRLFAPKAIVAAGAWLASSPALRELGRGLGLVVERQVQLWFAPPPWERAARDGAITTFVHFVGDRAFYAIPTAESVKVCQHHGGEETAADDLDRALRPQDQETVRQYLRAHLPSVTGPLLRSRVCMYTNTRDQHFVVGRAPRHPELILLGGFSGHGYKMAPAIGEIAAELVDTGTSTLDIAMFDPARLTRDGD